jgi:hypothetical protein
MGSTGHIQNPVHRRLEPWAALVVALLSIVCLLFWASVFVDALRRATGWELGRPMLFLVGGLLVSAGLAGSGVAARLAWVWPSRSRLMILAATLGLVVTFFGGFLTVSAFSFYPTPRVEIDQEHESSVGRSEAVAGSAGGLAVGTRGSTSLAR